MLVYSILHYYALEPYTWSTCIILRVTVMEQNYCVNGVTFFPQLNERLGLENIAADHVHFILGIYTSAVTNPDTLRVAVDTLVEALITQKQFTQLTEASK